MKLVIHSFSIINIARFLWNGKLFWNRIFFRCSTSLLYSQIRHGQIIPRRHGGLGFHYCTGGIDGFGMSDERSKKKSQPPEKGCNKCHDLRAAADRFEQLYFNENSVYFNSNFEKRFYMPKGLFAHIEPAKSWKGEFKLHSKGATENPSTNPRIKTIAALCVLAYIVSLDQINELCELAH